MFLIFYAVKIDVIDKQTLIFTGLEVKADLAGFLKVFDVLSKNYSSIAYTVNYYMVLDIHLLCNK